jgi:CDP-glycerol glycerophosphotransferase (TagB/SpsB family)
MRGGGGFGRRARTGGSGDGAGGAEWFTPGQDGNFAWNTTQAIADRPILLYTFDGHIYEGKDFDYSKRMELELFLDKEIVKLARDFVCEKICISEHEFLRKVKGREPISAFLAANMEKPVQRKVQIAMLDSSGKLIAVFNDPKQLKEGAPALLRELKKAREENAKRLAAAAPPAQKG